jgi:hypothetical protein
MDQMNFRDTTTDLVENSLKIRVAVFSSSLTHEHIRNSTSTSANEKFSVYLPRFGVNPASKVFSVTLSLIQATRQALECNGTQVIEAYKAS